MSQICPNRTKNQPKDQSSSPAFLEDKAYFVEQHVKKKLYFFGKNEKKTNPYSLPFRNIDGFTFRLETNGHANTEIKKHFFSPVLSPRLPVFITTEKG